MQQNDDLPDSCLGQKHSKAMMMIEGATQSSAADDLPKPLTRRSVVVMLASVVASAAAADEAILPSLDAHGVTGDGSDADVLRLRTALDTSARLRQPLLVTAGRHYRFRSQIRVPSGAGFVCRGVRAAFHFHAADGFTSVTRPIHPGASDSHLIYAEDCDEFRFDNIKIIFHPMQRSYVHGLCVRGGSGARISNFELTGLCAGYALKLDTVINAIIDRPFIHDCLLDMPSGNAATGQLSGIVIDDDKLNVGGRIATSRNLKILQPHIARLLCTPATITGGVGYQTDGITYCGYPSDQGLGDTQIRGGLIEEVYEGIDCLGGSRLICSDTKFRNIGYFAIKIVHGAHHNSFNRIVVDGAAKAAVVWSGSWGPEPTHSNVVRNITVTRIADTRSGQMPNLGGGSVLRVEDGGDGKSRGNARDNVVEGVRIFGNGSSVYAVLIDAIQPGTTGNVIRRLEADNSLIKFMNDGASEAGLATQVALEDLRIPATILGDRDQQLHLWEHHVRTSLPLTAPRTVFLPRASSAPAGTRVTIRDVTGAISEINTLSVRSNRQSNDILLPRSPMVFGRPHLSIDFVTDGVSCWVEGER